MLGFGPISSAPISSLPEILQDVFKIAERSTNPILDIREILEALEEVSESKKYSDLEKNKKYSKLKQWIPDTPEKLAAYAAILALVLQLLIKDKPRPIEINNTFITQYQVIINNNSYFDTIKHKK